MLSKQQLEHEVQVDFEQAPKKKYKNPLQRPDQSSTLEVEELDGGHINASEDEHPHEDHRPNHRHKAVLESKRLLEIIFHVD